MPNRIIRDAILSSEAVCSLNWDEEVFYRRLMSFVDDYGRCEANPQLLRSRCYPLQVDKVRVADISRWMAACLKAGVIVHYEVSGKAYLQIEKFGQQRRSDSKHPQPPAPDERLISIDIKENQKISNEHLVEGVCVGVCVPDPRLRAQPTPKAKRPRKTMMPEGFSVSDRVKEWAQAQGHGRLDEHLDAFKRKAAAKGYEYVDWDAAFMEAIRENWAKLNASSPSPSNDDWMRRVL